MGKCWICSCRWLYCLLWELLAPRRLSLLIRPSRVSSPTIYKVSRASHARPGYPDWLIRFAGSASPCANSGLIVLDARSFADASRSCQALGERLWSPDLGTSSIQKNLDYLKYLEHHQEVSKFWVGPENQYGQTVDVNGRVSHASKGLKLPVLCTNSAPFSSATSQDDNERWHVTIHSNNEYITGYGLPTLLYMTGVTLMGFQLSRSLEFPVPGSQICRTA